MRFKTILIDPPWKYKKAEIWGRTEAADVFDCMELADIARLPIPELAASKSHLWLWATQKFLKAGIGLVEEWGFYHAGTITWCKPTMGVGRYTRNDSEFLLLGVLGKLNTATNSLRTWYEWPRPKGKLAKKPPESYELIEANGYRRRLEVFARIRRPGWDVWGNEVNSTIKMRSQ